MKSLSQLVHAELCLFLIIFIYGSNTSGQQIIPTYDKVTHNLNVNSLSISEDNTLVLSTGSDGKYTIRDIETGKVIYYNSYDCVLYNSYFGDSNNIINLIAHSAEKSSIKKMNINTSTLIEENIIPDIPNIINIRSTISPDKKFIVFDNYNTLLNEWVSDEDPELKKYILLYDVNRKTTLEISVEENVENIFVHFIEKNKLIISYYKNEELIIKTYNPNTGSSINEDVPYPYEVLSDIHLINTHKKNNNYNNHVISITEPSPNKNLIAIGGGELLIMSASGGSDYNVKSSGYVSLWDMEKNEQFWPPNDQKTSEGLELIIVDIKWLDDYHFIAVDIGGNYHYYNITKDNPEKQVFEPQKNSIALDISNDFNKFIFSSDNGITGIFDLSQPDPLSIIDSSFNRFCILSESDNYTYSETYENYHKKNFHVGDNVVKRYSHLQDIYTALLSNNGQVAAYSSTVLTNSNYLTDTTYSEDFVYDMAGNITGHHRGNMMVYSELLNLRSHNNNLPHDPMSYDGVQIINLNNEKESYFLESIGMGSDIQLSETGRYVFIGNANAKTQSLFNNETKLWKYFNYGNPLNKFNTIKGNYFDKNSPLALTILDHNYTVIWNTNNDEILFVIEDKTLNTELLEASLEGNLSIDFNSNSVRYLHQSLIKSYNFLNNTTQTLYDFRAANNIFEDVIFSEYSDYVYIKYKTASSSYGNFVMVSYDEIIDTKNKNSIYRKISSSNSLTNGYYNTGVSKNCYFHNSKNLAFLYDGIGGLELINLDNRKTIATLQLFNNGDWLVYTPEGLFDANKNGRQSFYYTVNNEVILYDQIKDRFWETDLLNKIINGTVNNPISNLGIPLYPISTVNLTNDTGIISVDLQARNGGIGKVNLLINNTLRIEDINPDRKSSFTFDIKNVERFLFPKGVNEISIRTYNRDGWMNSRNNSIFIETDLEALKAGQKGFSKTDQIYKDSIDLTPGLFGLFVGTSVYKDPKLNLNFSDDDAIALLDGFQKIGTNMYDKDRMDLQILTSGSSSDEKKSSKENIITALDNIAKNALPHDIIVLFLSGHGMTIDEDFYYLTSDAGTVDLHQDTTTRRTVCLSSKEILENLKNIRSNKQVIVLDACHSGQITQILSGSTKALSTTQEKALEFLEDKMGVYILASSESNQKSFETEALEKGLLTFGLLRGMSGGASKNGVINVIDLLNYASNEAEDIGKRVLNRTQRPVLNIAKGGSSFPIGFENAALKVSLPKDKISIGESFIKKVLKDHIFHDPQKVNKELESLLKERGAFGASTTFIYTQNENENTFTINGTYTVENDEITIEWYILKNEEIFAGPFSKSMSIAKKTKLLNIIINRSLETINTTQ